jgi:hypothetical protein
MWPERGGDQMEGTTTVLRVVPRSGLAGAGLTVCYGYGAGASEMNVPQFVR